ncbi:hypothetical protein COW36_17850 [bacterium (Candidatus Blackallbacteria) CG17_big_fil_post_rev_8_21_14_2_50_48_46]|uniref:Uncharacterized protein n=1 Tax=bacterium (Candidatus Blackallbacteria) CG17_big_fil_post_rev_8_21_14_2_50_48_46 TaxID=2014261 RepID=A0A2M7G1R7_9BACT|nr:MAG: hypothetical protein COW64_00875 [bacterium (Candidatus Blackallbacteria) CG18_big_fil_WC_8_21_14_2_50_49_26]PIW15280.1 MAG: hypothetical protein COW36_17850 [bacterium (Candidatus Blackallbacteria) CG17_big_fil_post_rev_8_21_14_2_50_48_46]PIW45211.1 MAG: hypothetical protein COW20_21165 [bacterium (Candidatus Blackallbacteria) CG13_big_fil_rev_8_21_14_2_50_49_14]
MTSAICYQNNQVWGSNGCIEDILIKLIKYSPENSLLLQWSLEHYRLFFSGICCDLSEILTDAASILEWQETIQQALDDLKTSSGWTALGLLWIDENREALCRIAEAPPT